ncbi:MAG: accessory gene regulator B family protein [Bacilli bacterium]|nr:accessory gene regulator B family protein [Bacilli bacterium]
MNNINKYPKYLFTLKYIKLFSYNSARSLQLKLNQNHKEKYLYYYGFQIFYGSINKGLLLLIIGLALHILPQILVATLSFALLRVYIGGLHFDSYTKCAWVSLASLTTLGLLSKYVSYSNLINTLIFIVLLGIILKLAPIENKNRPLKGNEKIKFKYVALILLFALYIVQILINDKNINNSIMYGVFLSGIIALPIFNKIK